MHLIKAVSSSTVALVCSFIVACPAAGIIHPRHGEASTRNDYEKSARLLYPQNLLRTSLSQFSSLDKRGKGPNLQLAFFEPQTFLVPIQAAAAALDAFYTGVAINSHGPWTTHAPRTWIKMTTGTIVLVMTATEGTTIPWDFVAWFALQMLRYTERGFTGTYTANYVNPTVGNAIWVSLYHCWIGPLTDPSGVGVPAKIASCLNANAQAWFPTTRPPTR
ncbi:hypothetical protein IMSHALPRED_005747 [Imshaugia aleurites]|uniref:Uncharacterized protein n=1 Tax=Imshaugia aleurites TaxID=172621 RepID=A0A8H3FKP3_9LECA|nr:hypothetical protein IMSHALPRED_005747 [Imshaugia aleurites]